jgi:predicted DNA-binding WGR domain protein
MRIFMQTPPVANAPQRYYQLILQQDLLGGWTLIRESGQLGARSTVRREQYLDFRAAQDAMEKARDQQLKKGLKVMFSQGLEGPPPAPLGS